MKESICIKKLSDCYEDRKNVADQRQNIVNFSTNKKLALPQSPSFASMLADFWIPLVLERRFT
jgi:hypothetical protein